MKSHDLSDAGSRPSIFSSVGTVSFEGIVIFLTNLTLKRQIRLHHVAVAATLLIVRPDIQLSSSFFFERLYARNRPPPLSVPCRPPLELQWPSCQSTVS